MCRVVLLEEAGLGSEDEAVLLFALGQPTGTVTTMGELGDSASLNPDDDIIFVASGKEERLAPFASQGFQTGRIKFQGRGRKREIASIWNGEVPVYDNGRILCCKWAEVTLANDD